MSIFSCEGSHRNWENPIWSGKMVVNCPTFLEESNRKQ